MERIVELNRGPFLGAQPPPQELAGPAATARSCSTCGRSRLRRRPLPRSAQRARLGHAASRRRRRSCSTPADRSSSPRRTRPRREPRSAGLRSVGVPRHRRLRPRRRARDARARRRSTSSTRSSRTAPSSSTSARRTSATPATSPGSRNIPYRLLALGEADLPRDRPIVTICESGPRAVDRREHPRGAGFRRAPGGRRRHRLVGRRG